MATNPLGPNAFNVAIGTATSRKVTSPAQVADASLTPVLGERCDIDLSGVTAPVSNALDGQNARIKLDTAMRLVGMSAVGAVGAMLGPIAGCCAPSIRTNFDSGVIASVKSSPWGTSTTFSLPDNVSIVHQPPGAFLSSGKAEAHHSSPAMDLSGVVSFKQTKLPTRILSDNTIEVTNLNGSLTLLDPATLNVEHKRGGWSI